MKRLILYRGPLKEQLVEQESNRGRKEVTGEEKQINDKVLRSKLKRW